MGKFISCFLTVVLFLGQVFGIVDPGLKNKREGIYNYCPGAFELEDGTRYVYYCTNKDSYEIVDHIACRKGVPNCFGRYKWSEEIIVLTPTLDSWDGHHVCDPSVISGDFKYNGQSYKYLMAYLGCTSYDNQDNKIGLAVSNSPMEEFIKIGDAPFVDFEFDENADSSVFQWGVGQPSLVNMDCKSQVMMFYTQGDKYGTRTMVTAFNAEDLNNASYSEPKTVTNKGLKNLNGQADYLNNADFAYNSAQKAFYVVSDCHPYPDSIPNFISDTFKLTSIKENELESGEWQNIKEIGKKQTHFKRNHDTCLLRDKYGHTLSNNKFSAYYTMADENENWLWSYRIFEHKIKI